MLLVDWTIVTRCSSGHRSQDMIQKLQRAQNCAARLVAGQPRDVHICPVLMSYTGYLLGSELPLKYYC